MLLNFVFTGNHHTIWPCSLPESLSLDIIQAMILKFGGQLRGELIDLKHRTDILMLPSDHSTGSGRLSISESVHSHLDISD